MPSSLGRGKTSGCTKRLEREREAARNEAFNRSILGNQVPFRNISISVFSLKIINYFDSGCSWLAETVMCIWMKLNQTQSSLASLDLARRCIFCNDTRREQRSNEKTANINTACSRLWTVLEDMHDPYHGNSSMLQYAKEKSNKHTFQYAVKYLLLNILQCIPYP